MQHVFSLAQVPPHLPLTANTITTSTTAANTISVTSFGIFIVASKRGNSSSPCYPGDSQDCGDLILLDPSVVCWIRGFVFFISVGDLGAAAFVPRQPMPCKDHCFQSAL